MAADVRKVQLNILGVGLLQAKVRFDRTIAVEGKSGARKTRNLGHGLHEQFIEVVGRAGVFVGRNGLQKRSLDVGDAHDIAPVTNTQAKVPPEVRLENAVFAAVFVRCGLFTKIFLVKARLRAFREKAVNRVGGPTDKPNGRKVGARSARIDHVDGVGRLLRIERGKAGGRTP